MKIADVETSMRAKDIIKNSFKLDKSNTKFVAPVKLERTKRGFKCITVTKIPKQRSRTHKVLCNLSPGYNGYFNSCPEVTVDCDCGRYLFTYNYALNQQGAAIKDRTNGEPPVITNPDEKPGICKHGLVALKLLSTTNPYWIASKAPVNAGRAIKLTNLDQILKRVRKHKI